MNDSLDSIEFRDYPPLQPDEEYKFEILDYGEVIGTAHVKTQQDRQGEFWHLDDLFVTEKRRNQPQHYGTKLLDHLRQYLWSVHKLRIRVHPAIGQQAMEELVERLKQNQHKYTEEELDAMDEELNQAMQQPDFWEKQQEAGWQFDSKKLIEWYRKRGFTHDDPDGKHLWCYPD